MNPNQLCLFVYLEGQPKFNAINRLATKEDEEFELLKIVEWTNDVNELLALYRVAFVLSQIQTTFQNKSKIPVYCIGAADLDNTDFLTKSKYIFYATIKTPILTVVQVGTNSEIELFDLKKDHSSSLAYSKILKQFLEKTNGKQDTLIHDAAGQVAFDLIAK